MAKQEHSTKAERTASILALRQANTATKEIAAIVGVSTQHVWKVLREHGVTTVESEHRRIARDMLPIMAEEGYTSAQIAAEVGYSHEGIRDLARRMNVRIPADGVTRSRRMNVDKACDSLDTSIMLLESIDWDKFIKDQRAGYVCRLASARTALSAIIKEADHE